MTVYMGVLVHPTSFIVGLIDMQFKDLLLGKGRQGSKLGISTKTGKQI